MLYRTHLLHEEDDLPYLPHEEVDMPYVLHEEDDIPHFPHEEVCRTHLPHEEVHIVLKHIVELFESFLLAANSLLLLLVEQVNQHLVLQTFNQTAAALRLFRHACCCLQGIRQSLMTDSLSVLLLHASASLVRTFRHANRLLMHGACSCTAALHRATASTTIGCAACRFLCILSVAD